MNTVESIFGIETTITGLVELFKTIVGDAASILDNPSCYPCSLIDRK